MTTVPYENLALHQHGADAITLDTPRLFEKLVAQRRGGLCFELNGLFGALLAQLGYKTRFVAACTNRRHWEDFVPTQADQW